MKREMNEADHKAMEDAVASARIAHKHTTHEVTVGMIVRGAFKMALEHRDAELAQLREKLAAAQAVARNALAIIDGKD